MRATRKLITANFDDSRPPRDAELRTYNRASLQMRKFRYSHSAAGTSDIDQLSDGFRN